MGKIDLIVDSGAYGAWTRQLDLDVDGYIEFLKPVASKVVAVNLDVIPGEFGRVPDPDEVEDSASKSYDNLKRISDAGIQAMPVFHQGESFDWLIRMVEDGYDYVGISPANDRTTKQKQIWLDEVFDLLCGSAGYPQVKTHGFGMTALPLLARYPWYSCDSVSWMMSGGYGNILVPATGSWEDSSHLPPLSIFLSDGGDRKHKRPETPATTDLNKNFDSLSPAYRRVVSDLVEAEGFTIDDMRSNFMPRQQFNARFFWHVQEHTSTLPYKKTSRALFGGDSSKPKMGHRKNPHGQFRMVFTITHSAAQSELLNAEHIWHRLISYWYFFEKSAKWDIAEYIETGVVPVKKRNPNRNKVTVNATHRPIGRRLPRTASTRGS